MPTISLKATDKTPLAYGLSLYVYYINIYSYIHLPPLSKSKKKYTHVVYKTNIAVRPFGRWPFHGIGIWPRPFHGPWQEAQDPFPEVVSTLSQHRLNFSTFVPIPRHVSQHCLDIDFWSNVVSKLFQPCRNIVSTYGPNVETHVEKLKASLNLLTGQFQSPMVPQHC